VASRIGLARDSTEEESRTRGANAPFLLFNAHELRAKFDRQAFPIAHVLADYPLLQLPQLIELSTRLPVESVEYNSGDLPINQDPATTPRTGFTIEQTLRDIERAGSWMVIKNVEQDPAYRRLLDACLDELRPLGVAPGMAAHKGFIFVSSPGAVTPYHVDFEHNFLLQIRGRKQMTVFDDQDRELFSEVERERAAGGGARNLVYREEFSSRSTTFDLEPGVGLHVPLTAPHWVKVGRETSVSFSITFQSAGSDRIASAHRFNARLRSMGIVPRRVGTSDTLDTAKYNAERAIRRSSQLLARLTRRH
jgi:hypothetical protein